VSYVECKTIEHYEDGRDWRGPHQRSVEEHRKEIRAERLAGKRVAYDVNGRTRYAATMTDSQIETAAGDVARRLTESTIREVADKERVRKQRRGRAQ